MNLLMTTLIPTKFCTNSSHGSVADCTDVDSTVVDAANLCGKNTNARITVAAIAGK